MLIEKTALCLAIPHATATAATPEPVRARELSASTVLIAAYGEVDAASAGGLSDRIEHHLAGYRQLVLDLSRLGFFGTAGLPVLHRVHSRCASNGVHWMLVPGPEVQRLLRICDPNRILPTAPNIVAAVAALARIRNGQGRLRPA